MAVARGFRRSALFVITVAAIFVLLPTALAAAKTKDCGPCHKTKKGADTILVNGKIITVDRRDSIAQAVAIRDGRILAVGCNWKMAKYLRPSTEIIDLHGRTATPGMIDSHGHWGGTSALYVLDLSVLQVKSIADVQAKVAAQCQLVGPGQWVQGRSWAEVHLAEKRLIQASDLDPVSPNNPVFLGETSYHMGVANSYALALAGIDKNTPDPPGGVIDRYPDGTPTGILREKAQRLVRSLIPDYSAEQEREGTRFLGPWANSVGLTAVLYAGVDDDVWSAFSDVNADGGLTVRTAMLWSSPDTLEGSRALIDRVGPRIHPYAKDDDMLWVQGIKMFMDGAQDSDSHWSWREHYVDFKDISPGNYGYPVIDPNLYRAQVKLYHDAGLHVETHAIGDRAIDWVLESYKLAEEANPIYGLRHGIIHCDVPTDWALKTMPKMQRKYDAGLVYTNPDFMWWTEVIASTMGPELSLREMPYKTYEKLGIRYGFGTDWPVDPPDPKYSIWSALTRDTLMQMYGSHPFGLRERINIHQALRAQTRTNAYLLFMEDDIGSIEVGKYADIAVWDKDWYKATTDEIFNIKCEMTMLGGKTVYMADDTPISVR